MTFKNKSTSKKTGLAIFVIILTIFNLFLLYYIKYDNQHLPFSYFRLDYIGNLFNLIFSLFLIAGLIIYIFNNRSTLPTTFIYILVAFMTIFLFAAWISSKSQFQLPDVTILNQPLNKIFVSGLFFIYQFLQFVLIIEVWLSLSGKLNFIFLRSLIGSIVVTLLLVGFTFFYLSYSKVSTGNLSPDKNGTTVGVVLGAAVWTNAPSPSLKSRVDKAFNLYENDEIQKIQLTGGHAPGELSESEIAYKYLRTKNIDTNDVWIEKNTTSTAEQIQFIKSKLSTRPQLKNIVVISDSYHLPRVEQIADFYHLKLKVVASNLDLKFENKIHYRIRESAAILIFWLFAI
jgi:uncharacterized SAM-binding protein YcdF (DUF218 family)